MRTARQLGLCAALVSVFVIDNPQCGGYRATHAQLAQVYLQDGLYDQALTETRRAMRQEGADAQLLLLASLAQMGRGEVGEALDFLDRAIDLTPDDGRLYAALRDICLRDGRWDQVHEILDRANTEHPQSAWPWAMQGWLHARQERPTEAEKALRQAIELDVDHLFARIETSQLLIDQERFAEAETMLTEAWHIAPDQAQLLLFLGDCQLRQGLNARADSTFDRALATSAVRIRDIARIYYERQQPDRAITFYERALVRAPDDPFVLNNLAWTYAEEGMRLNYALGLSMRAVKLEADSPVYLDTYAELLHLLGRRAHAVAIMRRALELEPPDGEHRIYLEGQMAKFQQTPDAARDL